MPRIRTLKPEIWDSPDFMDLPAAGQLTFIALISLADDHGRLRGDARHLHLIALRQVEAEEVAEHLVTMERLGMVRWYSVDGRSYIQLENWSKHQKVDHARDSVYPPPPSAKARERSRSRATPRDDSRSLDPSRARADRIGPEGIEDLGPEGIGGESEERIADAPLPVPAEPERADVTELCEAMRALNVERGVQPQTISKGWREEARLILDRDKRRLDEALALLEWACRHEFWKANVLSLSTFRKQYDRLRLQRERELNGRSNGLASRSTRDDIPSRDELRQMTERLKAERAAKEQTV